MSRDIWISSDLHLNHTNILNFISYSGEKLREFDSVEEMNECILTHHNEKIKPGDIWYNLGDVFFGDKEEFKKMWPKFNGRKRLIVGNHDDVKFLSQGSFFEKISMWRIFSEHNVVFSHTPLHLSSMFRGRDLETPMLNVHGHIHRNESPSQMHFNVSVEKTDYYPIHIEELAKIAKERRENYMKGEIQK